MLDRSGFRGWWIVGVAFAAQALTIGLAIMSYAVFITPITVEFEASIMVANLGLSVLLVIITIAGPAVGALLDRASIRAIMTCGACTMAAAFASMSFATELWQLGAGMGLVACGMVMSGPLAATTVVAKWFDRKRGMATGIAAMGPPAGGLLLVPLTGWLIQSFDWRTTLQCYSVAVLAMAPLYWWIVRNQPSEIGQHPDGDAPHAASPSAKAAALTPRDIASRREFWVLAVCFGILFGVGAGWGANQVRFAEDLGHGADAASLVVGIGMGVGIPATLLFGALADRFENRVLLIFTLCAQIGALLWLRSGPEYPGLLLGYALFGFAGGGQLPIYASIIGRLFGAAGFGLVFGLASLIMLPFGSGSPPLLGALRDASGSYDSAVLVIVAFWAVSATLALGLRVPAPSPAPRGPALSGRTSS